MRKHINRRLGGLGSQTRLAATVFGLLCLLSTCTDSLALQIGAAPPGWNLPDVNGRMIYSSNFAGKVVILNFLLTYCAPCKQEAPTLVALQHQYRADGLIIVGVPVYQDRLEVIPFITEYGLNFSVCPVTASNPSDAILWDYNVMPAGAVPVTAIIDRNNVLVERHVGYRTKDYYEQAIRLLLYPPNTPPRLALQRSGQNLVILWPTNATNFVLEASPSLPSAVWTLVTNTVSLTNASYQVRLATTNGSRFFRLRQL